MELSRRRSGGERAIARRLMMRNRAPGGNERGLFGQAVIKQDRKLLRLERVDKRVVRQKSICPAFSTTSSSCPPLVPVMQSADFGDFDHLSQIRRLLGPWFGRVLRERYMGSGPMIILTVTFQNPAEMIFIEHDHMVEALS